MTLYSFVWDDFCSWYLELIKPNFGSPIDRRTLEGTTTYFEDICKLLHPFIPFLTEEIWHEIAERAPGNDCIVSKYPTDNTYATATLSQMESLKDIVTKVRDVRQKNSLSPKESLDLYFDSTEKSAILISDLSFVAALSKLANLTKVVTKSEDLNNATVFNTGTDKCYIPLNINLDVDAEKARLLKELEYAKGFIVSVENKLKNEKFVNSAPEIVLQKERQKMADGLAKLQNIQESLAALS